MKVLRGDKVKVVAGKDKGKEGVVSKVLLVSSKILVGGINKVKKHVKPSAASKEGGIISVERPIDVSNVLVICQKCNKPSRVGYSVIKGKKYRVCKRCKEVFETKKS
ncbi:MAG: 50S ribosomal protein L24 [candidate division WWE3 bacterium GW2011_GWA1_46_21]|uniref:Large ribosomal subunit protein uL24 n=4 Tax=Katanobacteria TaxID=422282 RepID=A0A0G1PHD3_UNCKA|nr:MAG: 50S ribosomal protein L24 [candidate division WWE3 bacterium GW2011_GWA1_46_21]KKU48338.1 MAG: 50S ribosomal protein L24 [candidate division WWE3 bacterium GW2011_GWA2_46_9]KKU51342.1 MAG: 50S ribosomal protein L24 [candidate division WWE3 bacterium GW2011_GWC1_47_10]KKU58126.1 MAG: 50S ribosomal protein L24 [candidate division WWE3 bacterium GW2011_GWB1_47_11]